MASSHLACPSTANAMHLIFHLLCALLLGVNSLIEVTEYIGGTAEISCPYDRKYKQNSKYLCVGSCPLTGSSVVAVRTHPGQTRAIKGRFSLYDDTTNRIFIVAIAKLTNQDTGQYWCGIERSGKIDEYMEVHIDVQQDLAGDITQKCERSDVACMLKEMDKSLSTSRTLPLRVVSNLLDLLLEAPQESVALRAEDVLRSTEKLVSRLVPPKNLGTKGNFRTNTTEGEVLSLGPNTNLSGASQLTASNISLEIDLVEVARKNNGSASAVLMVYNNLHEALNASFFKRGSNPNATMSNVISVVLPNALNKNMTTPVNLTLQHDRQPSSIERVSCVSWSSSSWAEEGCHVSKTNSTHTVCTCAHFSTFALIMSVDQNLKGSSVVNLLSIIFFSIGLFFLTLALMTFALCRWNPRVSNVARLNLCSCLLLAQLLFLITQSLLRLIKPYKVMCTLLSAVLHFLFLCCFVWMSIEAVLLFLSVRKLKQIKPNDKLGPHWKLPLMIGFGIPLAIVGVSAAARHDGYGSKACWLKTDTGFIWSFLGPVCVILAANIILFIIIFITIHSTLKEANCDVSKVKYSRMLLFKIMLQFVILGCPWTLGLFAAHSRALEILFLLLTSQQGTAIFLVHCLLNTEVQRQYKAWWKRFGPSHVPPESETGTVQRTPSTTLSTSPTAEAWTYTPDCSWAKAD